MDPATLITGGQINSNNVQIRTSAGAKATPPEPALTNVAASTLDNKTFVFKPNQPLGSASEEVWYLVNLTKDIHKANNQSALPFGYSWDFQVSTLLDNTPPKITKIRPAKDSINPRNTIVQINFSEAIDPTSIYKIILANGGTISGTLAIANQYQTVEFTPDAECGINACGSIIHCLPASATINLTVQLLLRSQSARGDFPL